MVALRAPLTLGFPRQEHWIGLPFPSPGDLLNPGVEPKGPALPVDSLPPSHLGSPKDRVSIVIVLVISLINLILDLHDFLTVVL